MPHVLSYGEYFLQTFSTLQHDSSSKNSSDLLIAIDTHTNKSQQNLMRVYHFTSEKFALESINHCRLKVSMINDLNDPYELLGVQLSDKDSRRKFKQKREDFANNFGILCFSKSWKNPVLWSHYSDKHTGICLGFDVPKKLLKKVSYKSSLKAIESNINTKHSISVEILFQELLIRKFKSWEYEEEYRRLVNLDKCIKVNKLYFYAFSSDLILKEIIIGPRCDKKPEELYYLKRPSLDGVKIINARLAFNTYTVVQNKQYNELVL